MGQDVSSSALVRADRVRYRHKVRRCLDVFALMLHDFRFDADHPMTGLEIELNLVDRACQPAMRNAEVLDRLENPAFQTELGQFNLELNVAPQLISGDGLRRYERQIGDALRHADERASTSDASCVLIGILPTLTLDHTVLGNISADPRYRLLNDQIVWARGENLRLDIRGAERLLAETDSIAPEAACTSVQFHLQVSPEEFAAHWNAAQAIAGVQVALGANSPYLFGRQLWAETRIALFEQATDTRSDELKAQGVRPRVWFGERWITSIFDLFEENVRYFPPLISVCEDEDPADALRNGGAPRLLELRLHNGTIYRWNRPVYDVVGGRPHLRVENRVLPAGPTIADIVANAAFYFGLVRGLAREPRPVWTRMPFTAAEDNFHAAARNGIAATVWWPGRGEVPVTELTLSELLPIAYEGLTSLDVDPMEIAQLLGIIEERCRTGRNGATWQVATVRHLQRHRGLDRPAALREMLRRYTERLRTNAPVHTWPIEG